MCIRLCLFTFISFFFCFQSSAQICYNGEEVITNLELDYPVTKQAYYDHSTQDTDYAVIASNYKRRHEYNLYLCKRLDPSTSCEVAMAFVVPVDGVCSQVGCGFEDTGLLEDFESATTGAGKTELIEYRP